MRKKGILFVDDEPNILSAIKRMLRSMRNEYDFYFAESGKAALEIMEREQIELVVSDMRMPEMNGAQLLIEIQKRYPHAIRIMLTGQADDESVLQTVSVVHQFLTKPCDPETLKGVLMRASALHDLMSNEQLKDVISGIDMLPSLPSIYAELQKVLNNPDSTIANVAEVIEKDVAMTAKLLQMVNSSFFGLFSKVDSTARAVNLLGLDTIKVLVLNVQIFSEIRMSNPLISLDYLWKHSMAVAQCCKKIALEVTDEKDMINNCFISGMLHDIGRLLLVTKLGKEYAPVVSSARNNDLILTDEEMRVFNATHADVGAYLIGLWGFTGDVVEGIAFHHDLERYPADVFSPALAVHVADACYHKRYSSETIGAGPQLNEEYLKRLDMTEQAAEWCSVCNDLLENSENA